MKLKSLSRGELALVKANAERERDSLSSHIDGLLRRRKQMLQSDVDMHEVANVLSSEITHSLELYADAERRIAIVDQFISLKDSPSWEDLEETEQILLTEAVKRAQRGEVFSV